jgi:hypothetical protein
MIPYQGKSVNLEISPKRPNFGQKEKRERTSSALFSLPLPGKTGQTL